MMFKFQLGDFWGATGAVHFFPETRFRRSKNLETPEAQTQEFSKNLACKAVDVIKACWKGIHISAREKKRSHVNRWKKGYLKLLIFWCYIWWFNDQVERIKLIIIDEPSLT